MLYVRALLRLALGATVNAVRAGMLTVVTEHLVALDCEIRWQDIATHAGGCWLIKVKADCPAQSYAHPCQPCQHLRKGAL